MESPSQTDTLTIQFHGWATRIFWAAFQRGVRLQVRVNLPLREIICAELGIEPTYFETRIQTIFLDGHPVDRPQTAIVSDGAVVALSGALPGLVGATLRRGGRYAPLREAISLHRDSEDMAPSPRAGSIQLKLFNQILTELVPALLSKGIRMASHDVLEVLDQSASIYAVETGALALANGRAVDLSELREILLQVRAADVLLRASGPRT